MVQKALGTLKVLVTFLECRNREIALYITYIGWLGSLKFLIDGIYRVFLMQK